MKPVEIAKGIYNVGAIDWNIRDFHGYSTHMGTSYNAYLIMDEKIALVDTVKKEYADHLLHNIARIVDPHKIDLVVSNHTELDHSGGLPRVMHRIGENKPLYVSKMGMKNHARHFSQKWNYQPMAGGDVLSLGERSLTFLETRMLHWPDSMFSYCKEEGMLFSSDAFGQHYAGQEMFDDVVGDAIMEHAKKYYANILLLYAPLILKLVDQVTEMGLEIKTICPDHGVIWRKDPMKIIDAYVRWSKQDENRNKAIIVYDTMWHSTEEMADAIATGVADAGAMARPMKLREWDRSDIMTEVLDAAAVVVGSPTLNNGLFPTVADFLTYMKGLKPKNKLGAAFGSYGWSGESPKLVYDALSEMKFDLVDDPLKIQYVPQEEGIGKSEALGRKIGEAILRKG
jgi:flavorubredoxin